VREEVVIKQDESITRHVLDLRHLWGYGATVEVSLISPFHFMSIMAITGSEQAGG